MAGVALTQPGGMGAPLGGLDVHSDPMGRAAQLGMWDGLHRLAGNTWVAVPTGSSRARNSKFTAVPVFPSLQVSKASLDVQSPPGLVEGFSAHGRAGMKWI